MWLSLLVVVLATVAEFGRYFLFSRAVWHATRTGAEFGAQTSLHAYDTVGIQNTAKTEANLNTLLVNSDFTATAYAPGSNENPCYCRTGANDAIMASCSSTCSNGFVIVNARVDGAATYTTLFNIEALLGTDFIPFNTSITRTVWMPVQ